MNADFLIKPSAFHVHHSLSATVEAFRIQHFLLLNLAKLLHKQDSRDGL